MSDSCLAYCTRIEQLQMYIEAFFCRDNCWPSQMNKIVLQNRHYNALMRQCMTIFLKKVMWPGRDQISLDRLNRVFPAGMRTKVYTSLLTALAFFFFFSFCHALTHVMHMCITTYQKVPPPSTCIYMYRYALNLFQSLPIVHCAFNIYIHVHKAVVCPAMKKLYISILTLY